MPALGVKLQIPTARRALVPRTRLTGQLAHPHAAGGATARLVLVAAPAGFGKTTLLTQWLHELTASNAEARVAWLSLDGSDSDLRRFLDQLIAAVRGPEPSESIGDEASLLLEAEPPPAQDVLASLINDLDTRTGRTVIALDDYHVIDDADVHQAVAFLLDNLPPQVTLAITTRADPPLPVARLRARGELLEIRAVDLRFTDTEATAFLNGTMGLHLDPEHVAALGDRTEGWAAGLQLAALSARGRDGAEDIAGFVESFSGSHRFVLDYLLDEVLARQPHDVRTFLLTTSILTQLTAGLCDAVTDRDDSQQMLERLEADGLFVIPLDEERTWFRYHQLFADALRARLPGDLPGRSPSLHASAARWLADNGHLPDAVHHTLAGGDQDRAADLVELGLGDQRRRRQDPTLRAWANRLDAGVVRQRPLLAAFVGWSRLAQGDVDGVEPWLDAAQAGLAALPSQTSARPVPRALAAAAADRDAEMQGLPSMISVYRAAVAQARGDTAGTVTHARAALDLAGPDDHFSRGAANGFLGLAAWAVGDLTAAIDTFTGSIANLDAAGMRTDALGSVVVLAQMWLARGNIHRARTLLEHALTEATGRPGPPLAITGDLHVALADVLREQGDLEAAETHLHTARTLGDRASLPENRHRWFTTAAGIRRTRGDLDGALALLAAAEELYLPGYFPDVRPIAAARSRLLIAHGRLDEAQTLMERRSVRPEDPLTFLGEHDLLTLARLYTATGSPASAADIAGRVLRDAHAAERGGSIIEARLVRALAHEAAGDTPAALDDLAAAVTLGAPAGFCRLYLDEPHPLQQLLGKLSATTSDAAGWAQRLLDLRVEASGTPHPEGLPASIAGTTAVHSDASRLSGALGVDAPFEDLSDREVEVLRLLDSELSGPEIARRLFVSINTFRTHTKHIFLKLDVQTRRAAVRRAAELGLL